MPRGPRYLPPGWSVEVTTRTICGFFLLPATRNFARIFTGILATTLVQSSSTVTTLTVGLVASGLLNVPSAIPVIMGANIGTTVTNTIVSMGHITRPDEFRRAMAMAAVRDGEVYYINAKLLAFCGELDASLQLVRAAIVRNYCATTGLEKERIWEPYRGDPAFLETYRLARECRDEFVRALR